MHLLRSKIRLLALVAVFMGAFMLFGSNLSPGLGTEDSAQAGILLQNTVSCQDIYFDWTPPAPGSPPEPDSVLVGKSITRLDVDAKGNPLSFTTVSYLGPDLNGDLIPDKPPTEGTCEDKFLSGELGPEMGQMNPSVKFVAVGNDRPSAMPVWDGVSLQTDGCSFSESLGIWIRQTTDTVITSVGKGGVNFGQTTLYLDTASPTVTKEDDPNHAIDPTECTGGIPFPSTMVSVTRNATTDHPEENLPQHPLVVEPLAPEYILWDLQMPGNVWDRVIVHVGKPGQEPAVLDAMFVCLKTGEMVHGVYKAHKKGMNDEYATHQHEVWSGTFSEKCFGDGQGVLVLLNPAGPYPPVVKLAYGQNTGAPSKIALDPDGPHPKIQGVDQYPDGTEEGPTVEFIDQGIFLLTEMVPIPGTDAFLVFRGQKNLAPGDEILIDQEQMLVHEYVKDYGGPGIDAVVVERGQKGTEPAPHFPDTPVLKKVVTGQLLADDWDGDGCPDWDELDPNFINGRDPFNPMDCSHNPAGVYNVLATLQAATKDPGTGDIIPGEYFSCIARIDKGVQDDLSGGVVCYQDSPEMTALSDTPPELVDDADMGPDGLSGEPPPPPYGLQPPAPLIGTYDLGAKQMSLTVCFQNQGGAALAPNALWEMSVDAETGKGDLLIHGNQTTAACKAFTPNNTGPNVTKLAAPIVMTRQAIDFDHDGDTCTDYQELELPQSYKCGDDPYNPHDSGPKSADLTGTYDIMMAGWPADWDKGAGMIIPGSYYHCKTMIDHDTATNDLTAPIFCYIDNPGLTVNDTAGTMCPPAPPSECGDGIIGSPPPMPLGEVPEQATPQEHAVLTGIYDKVANEVLLSGCLDDQEGERLIGNIWIEVVADVHTGVGTADIWADQALKCAGSPGVAPPDFDDVPFYSARNSNDNLYDSDSDGCSDAEELGPNPQLGGLRDPYNPWDFFDPTQDGAISGLDFFAVLGRFGATGSVEKPLVEPVPAPPAYHTSHDRGAGPVPGSNPWNTQQGDGAISGLDFFGVLGSFGGTCLK